MLKRVKPVRRRKGGRRPRRKRSASRWPGLAALATGLWLGQLALLSWQLRRFDWDAYWLWRGFYRPGVILFKSAATPFLPGSAFDPLNPTGAKLSLAVAALLYALAVAGVVGLLAKR